MSFTRQQPGRPDDMSVAGFVDTHDNRAENNLSAWTHDTGLNEQGRSLFHDTKGCLSQCFGNTVKVIGEMTPASFRYI